MALATGVMYRRGHRVNADMETHCPQPCADVNVLVIQIVTLVEATDFPECFRLKQHEHARNPIRLERVRGHWIIEFGRNAKRLAEN